MRKSPNKSSNKRYNRISKRERRKRNLERAQIYATFKTFKDYYYDLIVNYRQTEELAIKGNFELLKNPKAIIDFISTLKAYKNNHEINNVVIKMEDINSIDIGAISLLLSSVKELVINKTNVSGTTPNDELAEKTLNDSGFFSNITKVSKEINSKISPNNKNTLLFGYKSTKDYNKAVGAAIKNALEILTGTKQHYKPIYTIILEMIANSLEHAYINTTEHWILGISYIEQEDKLIFTFTDNGKGIIKNLDIMFSKKFHNAWKDRLNVSNEKLLINAFDKKYNSRYKKQINRNRGLPIIKETVVKGYIKNLICITNDVYLDIINSNSISLPTEFTGTFYYWELELNQLLENGK